MLMQNQKQVVVESHIPLENILVVPTKELFFEGAWQGLRGIDQLDLQAYMNVIQDQCLFLSRPQMEENFNYKQIIPYLIFQYEDKYFLMQRGGGASESRLRSKFSLGIGGHIREDDMQGNSIFDWARREFAEEVDYKGDLEVTMLGILNDDSNEVGQVHLGLVMLLTGDSDQIFVKSELKSGELLTLKECELFEPQMENWSKLVFDYLKNVS
jgi:predicted NUDIX family phosphoesterase